MLTKWYCPNRGAVEAPALPLAPFALSQAFGRGRPIQDRRQTGLDGFVRRSTTEARTGTDYFDVRTYPADRPTVS
jgi:hypothetical protein